MAPKFILPPPKGPILILTERTSFSLGGGRPILGFGPKIYFAQPKEPILILTKRTSKTLGGGAPIFGLFCPFSGKTSPVRRHADKRRLGKIRAERRIFLPEKIFRKIFSPFPAPPKGDSLGPQRTRPSNCSIYFAEFGENLADFARSARPRFRNGSGKYE